MKSLLFLSLLISQVAFASIEFSHVPKSPVVILGSIVNNGGVVLVPGPWIRPRFYIKNRELFPITVTSFIFDITSVEGVTVRYTSALPKAVLLQPGDYKEFTEYIAPLYPSDTYEYEVHAYAKGFEGTNEKPEKALNLSTRFLTQ